MTGAYSRDHHVSDRAVTVRRHADAPAPDWQWFTLLASNARDATRTGRCGVYGDTITPGERICDPIDGRPPSHTFCIAWEARTP